MAALTRRNHVMPSCSHADCDTSCASEDAERDVQGQLVRLMVTCAKTTSDMGGRNSVEEEPVAEHTVKATVAASQNCRNAEGFIKSRLSDVSKKVKARESERNNPYDNPVQSVADRQNAIAEGKSVEAQGNNETSAEKESIFVNAKPASDVNKLKLKEVLKDLISENESSDSFSSITTAVVVPNNCNQVKNKRKVSYSISEQKNDDHNSIPNCIETVDSASNNCSQDSDDVSLEIDNTSWKKEIIDSECISKKSSKGILPSHCQNQKSCEGASNLNNKVDLETSKLTDVQITHEEVHKEQKTALDDTRNGIKGISSDINSTLTGDLNILNRSVDAQIQQIVSEPKKKKDIKKKISNPVSTSADKCSHIFQKNQGQYEVDELHKIDNTRNTEHIETQCDSELSLKDVALEISVSECENNTDDRCKDNLNEEASKRLPIQTEFSQELNPNSTGLLTKNHSACDSSENSPIRKSPIFQRGLFPRIVLKDYGVRTINRLKRQLFTERERREKMEQREKENAEKKKLTGQQGIKKTKVAKNVYTLECDSTKICGSTDDIKLKCAQVCLMKMSESMLSKYVCSPSTHSDASVDSKLNEDVSLSFDESTIREKENIESTVPTEDHSEQMENNKFSPDMQDDKLQKGSNSVFVSDGTSGSETPPVKNISNSRRSCNTSDLEKISNNLTENDNSLLDCVEARNGSKRRGPAQGGARTKKQKQAKIKIARVHILKIDNSVLSKYGYDSQGLKIGKAATVPCTGSAQLSLVDSFVDEGNSQTAIVNNTLNRHILLNQTTRDKSERNCSFPVPAEDDDEEEEQEHLVTMMNSDNEEIKNNANKSTSNSRKITDLELTINDDDLPLCRRILLKKTSLSTEKLMGKNKCFVKKKYWNLKTPQVMVRRIEKETHSRHILLKKSSNLKSAKRVHKTKSISISPDMDKKIPQVVVRKIEKVCSHISLNRSQSTTKPVNKLKNSFKGDCSLKTAKVILENINNSPLSSHILSKNLPMKSESNIGVSKKNLNVQSSEILQERSSRKKQNIVFQSKFCDDQNQNEETNKAISCKNDVVWDHSKENVCLNSDLKCLRGVRVSLYKLESMTQAKVLTYKPAGLSS